MASNNSPGSIQLKIGGLVTNNGATGNQQLLSSASAAQMQRSFLGDISPPSSMCSTSFTSATSSVMALDAHQMAGSLITSNDFNGLNCFMLDSTVVSGCNGGASFNEIFETSRPQVFDDISMLNAPYENADADASASETVKRTDTTGLDDTFAQLTARMGTADSFIVSTVEPTIAANRSLQELSFGAQAPISSSFCVDDATFIEDGGDSIVLNETYDNSALQNRTLVVMDGGQPLNVTVDAVPSVTAAAAHCASGEKDTTWGRTLNDTFQLDQIQLENDCTFEMNNSSSKQEIAASGLLDTTTTYATSAENGVVAQTEINYGK